MFTSTSPTDRTPALNHSLSIISKTPERTARNPKPTAETFIQASIETNSLLFKRTGILSLFNRVHATDPTSSNTYTPETISRAFSRSLIKSLTDHEMSLSIQNIFPYWDWSKPATGANWTKLKLSESRAVSSLAVLTELLARLTNLYVSPRRDSSWHVATRLLTYSG